MSDELNGQAQRAAAKFLADNEIVAANDEEYARLVTVVALVWIDGCLVGLDRAKTILTS